MITKIHTYLTELDKKLTVRKLDRLMFKMATPEDYKEYLQLKGSV